MMKNRRTLLVLFVLTSLIIIFFHPYLSGKNLFFAADESSSDLLDFNYPQRVYLASQLKQLKLPLWTPYQSNGFPFLAEAQSGVFYPVNLILFFFLAPPIAFNWSIISAFLVLAIGMYIYLRSMGSTQTASFFGALVLTFAGFFVTQLKHVQLLQSAVWFPWILWLTEKLVYKPKVITAIGMAITITLSIFAGHIPTAYANVLFAIIYFYIRLIQIKVPPSKPLIFLALALPLSFFLSAIQLLPTLEMIGESTRTFTFSAHGSLALTFSQMLTFISPYIYGDPSRGTYLVGRPSFWENLGYVGLIPLLLTIWILIIKSSPKISAFKILFVVSLLFTLGEPKFIFDFLWNFLPGMSLFRLPSRFLQFVDVYIVILATYALDKLSVKFHAKKILFLAAVVGLSLVDLWFYFFSYQGKINAQDWVTPPQTVQWLKQDTLTGFRISTFNQGAAYQKAYALAHGWRDNNQVYLDTRELLPATLNSLFDVSSIHFPNEYFGAFSLGRRSQLSALTQGEKITHPQAAKLLGLQNVKYLLSMTPLPAEATASFELAYKATTKHDFPITIYENPQLLPRAYLVTQAQIAPVAKILPIMQLPEFDPRQTMLVENPITLPDSPSQPTIQRTQINLKEETDTSLELEVQASQSAYLLLTDTYYPGWHASVNDVKTTVHRANYAFRAIAIPSGTHTVKFWYRPLSFIFGLILSSCTLIGIFLFISCKLIFKKIT